jgi:hypothetical protein
MPALFRTPHLLGFHDAHTHASPRRPNITSIEKRRHRGDAVEGDEGGATPDLLLKYLKKHLQHTFENS